MKVSTQAIKILNQHYGSVPQGGTADGVDSLVQRIGAQLGAVEEVVDFGKRFEGIVIVKVVLCKPHPNADKLHVCKIDDGAAVKDIQRDEHGLVEIVCGASNIRQGMLAAWLPPGSTVPSTFDKQPFVLEARDVRGVTSYGMLASPKELTLGDNHEGILDIDEQVGPITPGTMFVDAFHLRDDVIIDMENKMFTHRPDCFGWLGVARELEGIYHRPYKSPEWYSLESRVTSHESREELKLEVRNELPELVPRFTAVAMSDVKVGPSPVWLQVNLARAGLRSINNIVDYTNWYMILTGQPLHAYDYDKVKERSEGDQATIVVRHPRQGEKITVLNGKEIEPRAEAIMIATDKVLLGVGGVMGGADTEVGSETKNIILEAANFDLYSIRRTSMAHGLFTDAVTRFNKGQSPLQTLAALAKIVDQIHQYAGGQVASPLIDDNHVPQEAMERGNIHPPVTVTTQFINDRLGLELSAKEMKTLLENVEFKVELTQLPTTNYQLLITAPFWRTDIEIPEDIVEEVGRLYGYDHLPLVLPKRDLTPMPRDQALDLKAEIRAKLAAAGANEVLSYSFVHGNLLDKVGQSRDQAFQLANALSPDLQYYRLGLTPSLLEKVHPNIKAGHGQFGLFELGKVHSKAMLDDEGLPRELGRVALVLAADEKTTAQNYAGAPYYQARKYLDTLLSHFGVADSLTWQLLSQANFDDLAAIEQMTKPFEPNRSAVLINDNLIVGVVGEYTTAVQRALKLPAFSAGFELFLSVLQLEGTHNTYAALPRFPKVEQDICLKVSADLPYRSLLQFVEEHLKQNRPDQTHHSLSPVDIYQRQDNKDHKQITLRLSIASFERTLTDQEVNSLLDHVAEAAKSELHAERI